MFDAGVPLESRAPWGDCAGTEQVLAFLAPLFAPAGTDYGLREGAHIDPDGNHWRFGSPLP